MPVLANDGLSVLVLKYFHIENSLVVAKQGVGGRMEWEAGVSRCRLLYMEWISSKVLLYGTENIPYDKP